MVIIMWKTSYFDWIYRPMRDWKKFQNLWFWEWENPFRYFIKIFHDKYCLSYIVFHTITNENEIDILSGQKSNLNGFEYQYHTNDETLTLLKKNFHLKDSLYLIAKKNDRFAAFVSMDRDWWEENCFFLREIFVSPDFQGQGLGK